MSYIIPTSRNQLMLPRCIEEYVSSDNIVRFIDAFVDKIVHAYPELSSKGKSIEGRPGYTPNCLCKLLIYGYLNGISSSRKLENESNRNLEAIWLLNNLSPDHWTISNFRKEHQELLKTITIGFRMFLKESGYLKGKSISTDGSKVKAYASRETLSMKLIDEKLSETEKEIERYFTQLNENDSLENQKSEILSLQAKISGLQAEVDELKEQKEVLLSSNRNSLPAADPESKIMKTKEGFMPAYNIQTTVDNESHFITTCQVTDHPNDFYSLEENIETLKEELGIVPETCLADGGYANEEQVKLLEEQNIECIVPFSKETERQRQQRKKGISFTYNEERDCFKCSHGKLLLLSGSNCKIRKHVYSKYRCADCSECPVKQHCTTSRKGRMIYRRIDGQWLNSYKEKSRTKCFKDKLKERKKVVEHPFGTMKYYMGQIPILLRGKEKVQTEMNLYATAYNLIRLKKIDTVAVLMEKLACWEPLAFLFRVLRFFILFWKQPKENLACKYQ